MISVIMATYKECRNDLTEAIESILNQTYRDFEFIIILDNPHNDEHIQIIKDYAQKDSRIKFYINEKNLGLANTLNRGISLANGEYIARMDADDISYPYRFEKQLKYIEENNYDLIGGITEIIDENGRNIYAIKRVPSSPEKIKKALKYGQCIAHPTWFGKSEVFKTLKEYRNIPLCEDYDFTLRAVLQGFKISNLNKIVLKYRMSSNSISRSNLFEQYLYMRYITKQYSLGKIAEIKDANEYVQKNMNDKNSKKYLRSNVIFNRMLQEMETKKFVLFVIDGFKLLFSSSSYLNKIYRFLMLTINS